MVVVAGVGRAVCDAGHGVETVGRDGWMERQGNSRARKRRLDVVMSAVLIGVAGWTVLRCTKTGVDLLRLT